MKPQNSVQRCYLHGLHQLLSGGGAGGGARGQVGAGEAGEVGLECGKALRGDVPRHAGVRLQETVHLGHTNNASTTNKLTTRKQHI